MGTHVIPELELFQAPLWISDLRIWNPLEESATITVASQLTRNSQITLTTVALALQITVITSCTRPSITV